jgi:type I restriction enzyme S subunit
MDFKTFLENFDAIAEAPGGIPKLRSLILDLAVRGKLVPQNPEDEPAEVFLKRALEARKDWYATACRLAEVNGSTKPRKPCLLMPQLLPTDYLYTVPRTWTFCFFENLAAAKEYAIKAGPFGSALKKQDYTERGYKIYGQEQVIKGDEFFGDYYIGEEKYQQLKSCSVEPGDLLISLVGTIGKTLTLGEGCEPGIINPRLVKFSLHSEINRTFIQIYLMSPEAMNLMQENAHGGTMDILNLKILSDLPIAFPPLAEQKRIVEKVDELMALCDRYEAAKQTRDKLQESLAASAISHLTI